MKPINTDRSGLDEMQKANRDRIGNQSFFLLFYLLLADCGLNSFGFHWLNYPANIMVILMVVMGISLVRMIMKNAYIGPQTKKRSVWGFLVAVAVSAAAAAFLMLGKLQGSAIPAATDNSALILFLVSAGILVIALFVSLIKRSQNKDGKD